MLQKFLPLVGALLLAGPASAISVNMSDFTFGTPASSPAASSTGWRHRHRFDSSWHRRRQARSSPGAPS
jgi:hypothetical protein